jgi:hypothetical protein
VEKIFDSQTLTSPWRVAIEWPGTLGVKVDSVGFASSIGCVLAYPPWSFATNEKRRVPHRSTKAPWKNEAFVGTVVSLLRPVHRN